MEALREEEEAASNSDWEADLENNVLEDSANADVSPSGTPPGSPKAESCAEPL